jgi:hypothetical protein
MRTTITTLAGLSALLLLAACSGGGGGSSSGPTYATTLSYTNPTSGAFQLVKDSASSGGNLVLDLVCTNGTPVAGVSFSFNVDTTKVTWTSTTAGSISGGTALSLGAAPQAVAVKVTNTGGATSNDLQGAVSQKGGGSPIATTATTVLAKVSMSLKGSVAPGAITPFADSGKATYLDGTGAHAVVVSVGALAAQ